MDGLGCPRRLFKKKESTGLRMSFRWWIPYAKHVSPGKLTRFQCHRPDLRQDCQLDTVHLPEAITGFVVVFISVTPKTRWGTVESVTDGMTALLYSERER